MALFAWVRDNTVLLPYCGALKGAQGVLLDRGGNALDRALLLRELLALAGHVSRLGHAELTPEQAAPLLGALERSVPTESAAVSEPTRLAERAAAELGLDAARVRAVAEVVITIGELWGGTPEIGSGGFCGARWSSRPR